MLLFPVLAIIMVFSSFIPANESEKYTSTEGHFSITFPGKPEESTQDEETEENTFYKIHLTTYGPSESEAYMMAFADAFRTIMIVFLLTTPLVLLMTKVRS